MNQHSYGVCYVYRMFYVQLNDTITISKTGFHTVMINAKPP